MSTEPFADYFASYALGVSAIREQCVRSGVYPPRPNDADEIRWAKEGPRSPDKLDTARRP